jgi:protein phosphatase
MKLVYAGATHVGMKRDHNEDNLILFPERNFFAVADGMGGHSCGEVASKLAVETLRTFFDETDGDDEITWPFKLDRDLTYDENRIVAGVKLANRRIFEQGMADARYKNMGTTFVGCVWTEERAVVAHVGDSRCYRYRQGKLDQVTEDHSLLNDYKKLQKMTPEEEAAFPHKNIIVRALGMKEQVNVDLNRQPAQVGDVFLLCSDGLSGEVPDSQIRDIMDAHHEDLEKAVEGLITAACTNGGKDNVTTILIKYMGQ